MEFSFVLWFVPISSKVDKYKKIVDKKMKKRNPVLIYVEFMELC